MGDVKRPRNWGREYMLNRVPAPGRLREMQFAAVEPGALGFIQQYLAVPPLHTSMRENGLSTEQWNYALEESILYPETLTVSYRREI